MKYYHVWSQKNQSGMTIAAEITEAPTKENPDLPYLVTCAVSYCAPMEANFSRPKGRMIAKSRLTSQKAMPTFKKFSFYTCRENDIKAQILLCLKDTLPLTWAKSLVTNELLRLTKIQAEKFFNTNQP